MSNELSLSLSHAPLTTLSDDELLFRDAVAGFANEEVRPRVQQMERDGKLDPVLIKKFFEMGLMGIEVPEQYGGAAGSLLMVALGVEEISKVDPSAAILVDVQNTLANYPIRAYGSEYIKSTYLPQLTSEKVGAYALSEPSSGSDAFGMQARAEQRGDRWILNGRKMWITNGAEAQIYVVFANANPSAGYKGITAFVVERGFKGFAVGKKEDKLGIRASSTTELILDDVDVPNENVLGPVGQGYKIAIETLNEGRIAIGAQMIGLARGALEHATAYAKERKQFGKAIGEFQAVQFDLAKMAVEVEAARLLVYNAARLRDAGLPFLAEAAMAKYYSSEIAERVASKAIEIHGGVGITKDYPVEKLYRDAKIGRIYEGTSNIQLMTIAKKLLGK
jgi:alkylation response protein AidB-like acyl-CoA dehydrogenase